MASRSPNRKGHGAIRKRVGPWVIPGLMAVGVLFPGQSPAQDLENPGVAIAWQNGVTLPAGERRNRSQPTGHPAIIERMALPLEWSVRGVPARTRLHAAHRVRLAGLEGRACGSTSTYADARTHVSLQTSPEHAPRRANPFAPDGPYAAIIAKVVEALPEREYAVVRSQLRFWRPSGDGPGFWQVEFDQDHRPDVLSVLVASIPVLRVCELPAGARSCEAFPSVTTLALSLPVRLEEGGWQVSVLVREPGQRELTAQYVHTLAIEEEEWRITRTELIAVT